MITQARIVGVHPVQADEPVHLIELVVQGDAEEFDVGTVTQDVGRRHPPQDTRLLEKTEKVVRYAFFFRYLDLKQPLQTPAGLLQLPEPTKTPAHLKDIRYKPPGISGWGCAFMALWIVFVAIGLTVYLALTHRGIPLGYLGAMIAPAAVAGWPIGAAIGRLFGFRMRRA